MLERKVAERAGKGWGGMGRDERISIGPAGSGRGIGIGGGGRN